jgi:hypothetical protein
MSVVEITNQLKQMSNAERLIVIEIATKFLRDELDSPIKLSRAERRKKPKKSAEIMLSEYQNNKELTDLTILDSEDFLNE